MKTLCIPSSARHALLSYSRSAALFSTAIPFLPSPAIYKQDILPSSANFLASSFSIPLTGAVEEAEVAVPADADKVDKQDAVVQRDELEVDELDERPDQVVGLEGGQVALGELVGGRAALHGGHAAEEDADHGGREDALVDGHARQDLGVLIAQHHAPLQELEPRRGGRAEYGCEAC